MKHSFKKLTAWLCCMAMLISFIPATALPVFADEAEGEVEWTVIEVTQTEGVLPALEENSSYELESDLTLTGDLTVPCYIGVDKAVTLDLAGHNLIAGETADGGIFAVDDAAGHLTIKDSSGGGKLISGASNGTPAVQVQAGEFTLEAGEITGWSRAGAGGMVFVGANGTFNMDGGKLTGASANYGAAIRCEGGTVNMNGGEISGNTATDRAVIRLASGSEMTVTGGEIKNNTATNFGAVRVCDGATFTMTDGVISGNTAKYGAGVYSEGTTEITGGTLTGNEATVSNGGAVYVKAGETTVGGDAIITENTAVSYAGGIFVDKNATLNIEGGEISENSANRGAGVSGAEAGTSNVTINISGGTIENNVLTGEKTRGANLYVYDAALNITGGTIGAAAAAGYLNTESRGGIVNISGGTIATIATSSGSGQAVLTITGAPKIADLVNSSTNTASTIGQLTEGADITYSTIGGLKIADGTVKQVGKNFTYQKPTVPPSGTVAAGEYTLESDLVLTNGLTIAADTEVVIDLAGNTISMPDRDGVYFTVNGKLTIKDSAGGGKIQFKNTVAGHGGINLYGTLVLESGELNGWTRINDGAYGAGGMINVWAGATFEMTGGKITGADCNTNAVIRTQSTGGNINVTISGGEISGNHAQVGNLIYVKGTAAEPATLTITGDAVVDGNTWGANNVDFAATGTGHEIEGYNTHIVIEDEATVGCFYNNGDAVAEGDAPYSSFDISGAPTVASVRWSEGAKTPIKVHDLTDDAEIKMLANLSGSQIDATVAKTTEGNLYIYSYKVPTYAVTVNQVAGGTIEVDVTEGIEGATVTVTATAAEGYELEAILVNGKAIDGNTFAIVAGDNVVTATFKAVDVSLPTTGSIAAGEYTLEEDLVLTGALTIVDETVIDLAGHTITAPEGGMAFVLGREASNLTIKDSFGGGKVVSGASGGNPAVFLQVAGAQFTLDGGEITGWNRAGGAGGMVYLLAGTTFTMNGGKLTNASCAGNSIIRTGAGESTITINGGEISGNSVTGNAPIGLASGVTMNITDGVFTGNTAGGYGLIQVGAGATLNISGGEFTKNTAKNGGVIYNEGTVAITGGTFTDNEATTAGGAIQILKGSTTTITGGTFTGNTSARGGAIGTGENVVADARPVLTIGGDAVIENNIYTEYGANIYAYTANITIEGGSIGKALKADGSDAGKGSGNFWLRGNNASNLDSTLTITGGEIYGVQATDYTTNVSGNPVIGEINVSPAPMTMSALTSGAKIHTAGVSMVTAGDETVYTENNRDYIFVGDLEPETYTVVVVNPLGGTVSVDKNEAAEGETITVTAEAADGYELKAILVNGEAIEGNTFVMPAADVQVSATFTEIVPEGLPTSGSIAAGEYTLGEDLVLTGALTIVDETVIDLAGHTITAPEGGMAFVLGREASNLTIKDSFGGGKVVSGASAGNPAVFLQVAGAQFTLDGGEITGWNRAGGAGGMVYLLAGTTFTMNGGKLTGSSGGNASAIRTANGDITININGGEISGNATTQYGAIYLGSGVTMNITDGTFTNNTAATEGGLFRVAAGATLNISGGEFTKNTAKNGGVIYNEGTVAITGGTFTDNEGTTAGGAIQILKGSTTTITGGTFTGNTSARGGAIGTGENVLTESLPVLTIGGDVVIEDNICTDNYGANLYAYTPVLTINGGTIGTGFKGEEVVSKSSSANVWVRGNAATSVTITGGDISGLTVSNAPTTITGNPVIGEINATINMSALTSGANIRTAGVGMVTAGDDTVYTTNDRDFFFKGDLGFGDKFVAGETVTLTENTSVGAGVQLTAAGEYTLDLAGFELTGNAAPYFTVGAGVKLTVIDSSENKTGKVVGLTTATEAMILVDGGEFVLNDGALTGHTSTKNGGAIRVKSGSATMNGGSITGNTAVPTFTWNEAKQIYTLSNGYGAGVYLEKGAAFTMNGGEISGNTASRGAGVTGVEMGSANFTITLNGGTIKDNTAYERGANVYAYDPALVTFGEVTIGASYDKNFNGTPELEDDTVTLTTATYRNIEVRGGNAAFTGGTYKMVSLSKGSANVTATISGAPKIELLNANYSNTTIGNLTTGARIAVDTNFPLTVAEGDKTVYAEARLYRYAADLTSVLVIGNSFGGDTINYLAKLGGFYGKEIKAANMYIGSQNFRWHALSLAESLRNEDLNGDGTIGDSRQAKYDGYNEDGRYQEGLYTVNGYSTPMTIPGVLDAGAKWDYIVLQNGVEYVGFEGTYNSDVQFLIDYIQAVQPEAKIFFNQTWAEETGSSYLTQFGGSQKTMYNAILANTEKFFTADDARFGEAVEGYFPIGTAIQMMRDTYSATPLTRDGFHLSLNAGRMIAGLTVMKTLFDIDLSKLTAADMTALFDVAVGETTDSSNDAFAPTEENVAKLIAAVEAACGYAAAGTVAEGYADAADTANKQFNPDAAMLSSNEFVAVYENVTEMGQALVKAEGEILRDGYATAGAGKIVIYKNGTEVGTIDELWLEENAGIVLTDRYNKIANGEEYYIIADAQAPQLAVIGSTLYLTFDVKLYTDDGRIINGGIYMTTSTDGETWTPAVKVSDAPMAYGLTALSDGNLILSIADITTKAVKISKAGAVISSVELESAAADVAFAEVNGKIFALTSNGALYVSGDLGESWTATAVSNGATASPDLVVMQNDTGKNWYTLYASWSNEAERVMYNKVWTIDADDADYGWSQTEASVIANYTVPVAYSGKTSAGQPATYYVGTSGNKNSVSTVKIVYVSGGEVVTDEHSILNTIGHVLALDSSLTVKFLLYKAELEKMGAAKVAVTISNPNATRAPETIEMDIADLEMHTDKVRYVFPVSAAAKQMGDDLVVAVYDANGKQLSFADKYSVRTYINNQLKNLGSATGRNVAFRTLLVDLLNYGAAAQVNFKHATTDLVNANLTAEQKSWASADLVKDTDVKNDHVNSTTIKSNKVLALESAVEIKLHYKQSSLTNVNVGKYKVSYTTHGGTVADEVEYTPELIEYNGEMRYQVVLDTLGTADVQTVVTCGLYDTDGNFIEGSEFTYSVQSYCYSRITNTDDLGEVCRTMMKAGLSAYDYYHYND